MEMFCRQCEQTAQGGKCSQLGVCGKTPNVAALQDAVVLALTGLAFYGKRARERGIVTLTADRLIIEGLFSTVTNVNFDEKRLAQLIREIVAAKKALQNDFLDDYRKNTGKTFAEEIPPQAEWEPEAPLNTLSALAAAFNCSINDLPLSLILRWYEQKAVAILLTLLSLGIKNIRIGPTLPAFISPDVLNVLVEKFSIKPITTPDQNLKDILQKPEAVH
jgi:hydroxylamine reductase (hybrid-cluster protein)